MRTNESNKNLVIDFLKGLSVEDLCITDYVSFDDIDETTTFETLTELIEDNNGFDIEIIYYTRAIEYLSNNDASLKESLEIADELGYSAKDLSSEVLASLLASQNCRNEWQDLENEVESFLLDLEWEEE